MEEVRSAAARAVLGGRALPESMHQTVTLFKMGFGGRVVLFPGAYDHICNPVFRWTHAEIYPRIRDRRSVKRLIKGFRTRSAGSGGR